MGERTVWQRLRPWIFLAALLMLGAYVLSRPVGMPRLANDASADVLNEYRMEVERQLATAEPDLADAERRMRSAASAREYQSTPTFSQEVTKRTAEYRTAFSNSDGPFLLHNDPYHYLRQAENLERYGTVGTYTTGYALFHVPWWTGIRNAVLKDDPLTDPVQYREYRISALQNRERILRMRMPTTRIQQLRDPVINAPNGATVESSTLPHLISTLSRITGRPVHTAAYWYPVLIGLMTIAAMFALIRMLSNDYGAFFGGLLLALHPAFFAANEAGYADTNALILLCMALIGCGAVLLLRAERMSRACIASALLGLSMWLLAETWSGVVSMAAVLLLFTVVYCIGMAVRQHTRRRYALIALIGLALIAVPAMMNGSAMGRAFTYLGFTAGNILPNPYMLIAELSELPLPTLIKVLGGIPLLAIMLAAIGFLCWRLWKQRSPTALFLACWLAGFAVPALRVRFFVFFLVPLSALVGMALGEYLNTLPVAVAERRKHRGGFLANVGMLRGALGAVLTVIIVIAFLPNLRAEMYAAMPILNSATAKTAERINAETPANAIINAWWDAGYFYETLAERPTLTDGASPGDWKSYWLANAYLDTSPVISAQSLRLLDCGGEQAILAIPNAPHTTKKAMVQKLLAADEDTAREALMAHGNIPTAERTPEHLRDGTWVSRNNADWMIHVLQQTHCTPPEAYLILSEDLLRKLAVLETYQRSSLDGSVSGTTGSYALPPTPCERAGGALRCGRYLVDLRTERAEVDGTALPLLTLPDGSLVQRNGSVAENSLMLYRDNSDGNVYAMELKAALFETVLGKLYFETNPFPEQFVPFSDFSGPYSGRTVAYRIVWPSADKKTEEG